MSTVNIPTPNPEVAARVEAIAAAEAALAYARSLLVANEPRLGVVDQYLADAANALIQ